ncbi:hypothetical protein NQ317_006595 [Molorchus minor]|uniref:Secreted protein n=1 Tax=Molorchus minor TaxID=1323400 RepID=A0ABQ9JZV2_9CUCU|nr:hypothetical protein NQ317_006595 [Molorchus minor]
MSGLCGSALVFIFAVALHTVSALQCWKCSSDIDYAVVTLSTALSYWQGGAVVECMTTTTIPTSSRTPTTTRTTTPILLP